MQQSSNFHLGMSSPYNMLWQYFNLMTPDKTPEYPMPPTLSPNSTFVVGQHQGLVSDHYINNFNYRLHHLPHPYLQQHQHSHHHLHQQQIYIQNSLNNVTPEWPRSEKKQSFPVPIVELSNNSVDNKKNNISNSNKDSPRPNSAKHNASVVNRLPHKKGSSFMIDAILNKNDVKGAEMDIKSKNKEFRDVTFGTPSAPTTYPAPRSPSVIDGIEHTQNSHLNEVETSPSPPFQSDPYKAGRRHDRLLEITHPYFYNQYESQHSQPRSTRHHFHAQSHPNFPDTPSSKSTTSSSDLSSASTSPESTSAPIKEKGERKSSGKSKRIRTIFTPEQLERLEAEFERQQYMVGTERYYLAAALNLTEAQVKVWFQNRRIKWRKQHLEQQQARLAQGDLYQDIDEDSGESEVEDDVSGRMNIDESGDVTRLTSMDRVIFCHGGTEQGAVRHIKLDNDVRDMSYESGQADDSLSFSREDELSLYSSSLSS